MDTNLITTNSYFNLFPLLTEEIKQSINNPDYSVVVFCEEKISLMAERCICSKYKGSFNTEVFSFGNFVRKYSQNDDTLSKEGSSMVIRRIISNTQLNCFKANKKNLAPSLFNLIILLKSAKITPDDIKRATEQSSGMLKAKLQDIATVFSAYEEFLTKNKYNDSASALSKLPEITENSQKIKNAHVVLFGYTSFTRQMQEGIKSILKTAKKVTAILPQGKNTFAFVNETPNIFAGICREQNCVLKSSFVNGDYSKEGQRIADYLFNPQSFNIKAESCQNIYKLSAKSVKDETDRVAESVKKLVLDGARYRDITLAVPDLSVYRESLKDSFNMLGIPFFIDEKRSVENHPLVALITSYIDALRSNLEKTRLATFYKNPLVCMDKDFADRFENYVYKYNINYSTFKNTFIYPAKDDGELKSFNAFRQKVCSCFESFNVLNVLEKLDVKGSLEVLSKRLKDFGEEEESAVNDQIYDKITNILNQMSLFLDCSALTPFEFKNVFNSGVLALELSILPQYNDAVFIGGFKQAGLYKNKFLFVLGLKDSVPNIQEDVALLTDDDINTLANIKLLVEPKINIINHRERESISTGIASFSQKLFLSYPIAEFDGKKNSKSEVLSCIERLFTTQNFDAYSGYVTERQAYKTFALDCGRFSEGRICDFDRATDFYYATDTERADKLLERANREVQTRLNSKVSIFNNITSPTTIEDYYKCPYKTFLSHGIKLKERESGDMDSRLVGTLMHSILSEYVANIDKVVDKESSDLLVENIKDQILLKPEYSKLLTDGASANMVSRTVTECGKFCYKIYCNFKNSKFKTDRTNLEKWVEVPMPDGKTKLGGMVDRVDFDGDYYRIIDYKTGSVDSTDKALFSGTKLQLFLYANAFDDKILAGVYYLGIKDAYKDSEKAVKPLASGKTLDDEKVIFAQDNQVELTGKSDFLPVFIKDEKFSKVSDAKAMKALRGYAMEVAQKATTQMQEGVIVSSPYSNACENCEYKAMCDLDDSNIRSIKSVDESTIVQAMEGNK